MSKPFLAEMKTRADLNGTTIEAEILADGRVREDAYYAAFARSLGLRFVGAIDAIQVIDIRDLDSQLRQPACLRILDPAVGVVSLIVPEARHAGKLRRQLDELGRLRDLVAVTSPSTLRRAVWEAGAGRRAEAAANDLFDRAPDRSARSVLTGGQGFLAGSFGMAYLACLVLLPAGTLHVTHVVVSVIFCVLITLRAFATRRGSGAVGTSVLAVEDGLPVYTVLVALYREKEVLDQLVRALRRLDWPVSRLDIKLVCEARDPETVAVLSSMALPPHFEIVVVPDVGPRTKPKALNYALAGARGDYVVIYDAEDRPNSGQLREAYARFREAPQDVVCLQAPLIIANASESWISTLFALEYSGLFRRLLPYLGAIRQPMPLGGTSNHFRTGVLRDIGAWDPYNVTEDADLGMRLYRAGYRADTLMRYTVEDAPTDSRTWIGQRTRWFKGWMQTWLVLMRKPVRLTRELGVPGTLMFHVLVTSMLVSALGHPLVLTFIGVAVWDFLFAPQVTPFEVTLFAVDGYNIIFAYAIFVRLGWQAMGERERAYVRFKWRYVPAYWMLLSLAAWRAAFELRSRPFFWSKTPHKPSARSVSPSVQGGPH